LLFSDRRRGLKDQLKLLQIGLGSWGMSWIEKAMLSENVDLVGLIDIKEDLLDGAASTYGFDRKKCFLSLKDALKIVDAEAALVVVPPEYHKPVVLECLENGLHCLVEKPLAENIADSAEMVKAAKEAEKKLMVSQNYRFKCAPQTVKNIINRNLIGDIGNVFINFQKDPPFTGFRTEMFEPLITDMSIHHFDQIRGILGLNPVTIKAKTWNPKWSRFKGNACANVIFEMSNGSVVIYNGSWVSRGWETTWDGDWHIQGEVGEIHWANNKVVFIPKNVFMSVFQDGGKEQNGRIVFDLLDLRSEERMAAIQEFVESINDDREPQTSGEDNLLSFAMVFGAKYSSMTGETVKVSEILDPAFYKKFSIVK
jgi:predicted dehydrogenase